MIDIYFENKGLIKLTEEKNPEFEIFESREKLQNLIDSFKNGNFREVTISYKDLNSLFQNFKSLFIYEEAAGGLVVNRLNQFLVIKVRDVWQFPKGHVEANETYGETAIREVVEESSISQPTIIAELPKTYHCFKSNGKWFFKKTYWYKMIYEGIKKPIPQKDEGITDAIWVDRSEKETIMKNTYKSIYPIFDYV